MRAVLPLSGGRFAHAQERFVREFRRSQGHAHRIASELAACDLAQYRIRDLHRVLCSSSIAAAPTIEQLGQLLGVHRMDLVGGGVRRASPLAWLATGFAILP